MSGPAVAISAAEIEQVSAVAETNVVVLAVPLKLIEDIPLMKLVPVAVRVNAAPPATAVEGLMLVSVGAAGAAYFNVRSVPE